MMLSMPFVRTLAILLAFAAVPANAAGQRWQDYVNGRFGMSIEVPPGWTAGEEPDNGDGRTWTSPDQQARILVWGSLDTGESHSAARQRLKQPGENERITYDADSRTRSGGISVTVSGVRGPTIFYRRHILACGGSVWINTAIEYPQEDKADYDAVVARVARSLKAGNGLQTGDCAP